MLEIDLDDVAAVLFFLVVMHSVCAMGRHREIVSALLQYHDTETLLDGLENNTVRYIKIVCEAADAAMPMPTSHDFEEDVYDILYNQVPYVAPIPSRHKPDCSQRHLNKREESIGVPCAEASQAGGAATAGT